MQFPKNVSEVNLQTYSRHWYIYCLVSQETAGVLLNKERCIEQVTNQESLRVKVQCSMK